MSLVHIKKPDELMTCPYNSAHRVKSIKFAIHITKCAKNYRWAQCPFNATHRMPEGHRAMHIATCVDRAMVERDFITSTKCVNPNLCTPPYDSEVPEPTEDWDAESTPDRAPGYDPTKRMNELSFRNAQTLTSMSRAEKKAFYNQLRTQSLDTSKSVSDIDSDVASVVSSFSRLRLPKEDSIIERMIQPAKNCGLGRGQSRVAANIYAGGSPVQPGPSTEKPQIETFLALSKGRGKPIACSLPEGGTKAPSKTGDSSSDLPEGGTNAPSKNGDSSSDSEKSSKSS